MLLHETFAATPLDRTSLSQGSLNIEKRVRTNPLPWAGQFSPQLVEELLRAFSPDAGLVLDPFVGSGTLLGEAVGIRLAACGCDVNPAAVILARTYELANVEASRRATVIRNLASRLYDRIGPPQGPLFVDKTTRSLDQDTLEISLVDLWRESPPGPEKILAATLVILCDFHRKGLDADRVHSVWWRLNQIVGALRESDQPVTVHHADARTLPVETGSVDLVLTSPPYINVHNYHQQFRRSVEALSWNVLTVARSEIGSNRQNRGNRFLTVIQYSLDMMLALREMARVTRLGGRLILVLGRVSSVRGVQFFNGELVTELAVQGAGLLMEKRQERVFQNRYGADIYEDILHFRTTQDLPDKTWSLGRARRVAGEMLSAACRVAPHKEQVAIADSIERLDGVSPSPLLTPTPFSWTST